MTGVRVWRDTDGSWWIGKSDAWHIAPVEERNKAYALAAALDGLAITRDELHFDRRELRERFDAEFGSPRR